MDIEKGRDVYRIELADMPMRKVTAADHILGLGQRFSRANIRISSNAPVMPDEWKGKWFTITPGSLNASINLKTLDLGGSEWRFWAD
jgi:hypothetical protein